MDFDPNAASGRNQECDDPVTPTQSLVQNSLKGRYVLVRELGRGGFGTTYLATDKELAGRNVVVKVLFKQRALDAWGLKRFKGEMEALARIDHPGVVSVIDFGNLPDEMPFLVMQYVPGTSLSELIPRGGMPLGRMAHIVRQIGRALSAAHAAGVCHRDLKPANIMVQTLADGEEQVKLIDFGLATVQDLEAATSSSKVAGTWEYMAPEQFAGKSSPVSDVYQFGVVAYEIATGVQPFHASAPAHLVTKKKKTVKVPPMDLRPDLPSAAQDAILKALSPNPQDRYQQAAEFGDTLARALISDASAQDLISTQTDSFGSRRFGGRGLGRRSILAAGAVTLLGAAAILWFQSQPQVPELIAVLPFENRVGDPEMEYVSHGITESLIDDLSRIPTLRVSALGSVLRYDNAKTDARAVGRELKVNRVVRGSVSRLGEQFRIEAELVDVRTGAQLWGRTYTAKTSSLPDVFERFSTEVTDQLRLKLSGPLKDRLARQYATGSESYKYYLQGRLALSKRTPGGFDAAVGYFDQAIAKNTEYAPAHAGLAYTYAQMASYASVFGNASPARALEQARTAARRALELDGTLAEAYNALGFVQMQADYQWDAAEKTQLRAIELNPTWADARECYALELAALGRSSEAVMEIEIAERLEPDSWALKAAHATILYYARRYDESLAIIEEIAKGSQGWNLGDLMAQDYWAKSMPVEALTAVQRLPESFSPHIRTPLLVAAYARAGQEKKARELLAAYPVRSETAAWYYLALAHMALGERAEALRALEEDYGRRSAEILFIAVDPMMDNLRADPQFRALLARMKLESAR
jgi:serine/threonine protein kinase